MPGPRPKSAITLAPEQEARLQQLSACFMAPFAVGQRAQKATIVTGASQGIGAGILQVGLELRAAFGLLHD